MWIIYWVWHAVNYAITYPKRVEKLILLSPIQTFAKMYLSYFIKIMKMGFKPTRESVEKYLGWGNKKEASLPDSVIEQFTISALNINSNGAFPKMINWKKLSLLKMPVMALFGENEFAFDINKATSVGKAMINNFQVDTINDASHLISVSSPNIVNQKIINFIER